MEFDPQDIGTRFDSPATADQLMSVQPTDTPPTLFSILKGILLQLLIMNDSNQNVTN